MKGYIFFMEKTFGRQKRFDCLTEKVWCKKKITFFIISVSLFAILKTFKSHVREQNHLVSACEWKTLCWNIIIRNYCKIYRRKMEKHSICLWNQEELNLSRSGYSETFGSRGSFTIPIQNSLLQMLWQQSLP